MTEASKYHEILFNTLAESIESVGKDDPNYSETQKALDILDVLESLLAYAIYSTSNSLETVRDSAEESYINIKKRALHMMNNELNGEQE